MYLMMCFFIVGVDGRFWSTSEREGENVRQYLGIELYVRVWRSQIRTQDLSVRRIRPNGVNNREGEFAFCEIFSEALVIGVLSTRNRTRDTMSNICIAGNLAGENRQTWVD